MNQSFYDAVEAERARRHWTIAQTAEALGITEKTYRTRMYKCQDIKMSELMKYVELFEVSADYLLGLSDKVHCA